MSFYMQMDTDRQMWPRLDAGSDFIVVAGMECCESIYLFSPIDETNQPIHQCIVRLICFIVLILAAAGCTFEEDSDPNLCDFTQGEEDDFDWLLFRTYSSPFASPDLLRGECCSLRHLSNCSPV